MIEISCEMQDAENCGVNTEQLIVEVEVRPVLYDQSLHRAFSDTEVLRNWSEVANVLSANRTDCLRTWKKMVKTFSYFHQTSESLLEQWTFYDQMKFLMPYAKNGELVVYDDLDHIDEDLDHGDDFVDEDDGHDLLDETDEMDTDAEDLDDPRRMSTPIDIEHHHQIGHNNDGDNATDDHIDDKRLIQSAGSNVQLIASGSPSMACAADAAEAAARLGQLDGDALDNEDLFLLSFAPNLMRLSAKQNAMARLRILEELYKLEFE